jgi:hypothetical protein
MQTNIIFNNISVILGVRNVSDKGCRETQNTFYVQQFLFFSENCAVYEIMWTNVYSRTCSR